MKQIFDWLREQIQEEPKRLRKIKNQCISLTDSEVCAIEEKAYGFYRQCIDEAEAKWGGHAICYLDSPCEYQNEDISVVDVGISCELLVKLIEPSKRCSHGLCEFRTHEECVSFEYCENCFADAVKDLIKNSDSRFRKIMEVE